MLLLGLLAGVAGPRFFGALSGDLGDDIFAQEMIGAVRYAQKLAIASNCRVQLDFTGGGYALAQETGCAGGSFGVDVRNPGTGGLTYTGSAPSGITIASSVDPLLFDALGRATTSGGAVSDVSITVGGRSISVAGETGLAWLP